MGTFIDSDTSVSDINLKTKKTQKVGSLNLPCISVVFNGNDKYGCRICEFRCDGKVALMNHVKGTQHASAQKKYGCHNISLQENSQFYCGCCDCKLSGRKLAFEHIKEEKHMRNANLPCISMTLEDGGKYRCKICNVVSSSDVDAKNHVKGKQHAAAQKKYGCDNITLKEGDQYYCRCCDTSLLSRKLASEHIKTKMHVSNINLFSICDMLVDVNTNHCTICNVDSTGEIDLKNHLNGRKHSQTQKKYVRDNISFQTDNLYYCTCCDSTLSGSRLVCDHIKDEKHTRNANSPCIFVTWVEKNKYLCKICEINLYGEISVESHVAGRQHTAAKKKYRTDNISQKEGNMYYCGCCDCTLSSRKLASDHIKTEKHLENANLPCISIVSGGVNSYSCRICSVNILGKKSLEDHVNGSKHATAQKKYRLDNISLKEGNRYYCGCCDFTLSSRKLASDHIKNGKHFENANLPCISIALVHVNKYSCRICDVDICGKKALEDHVNGFQHATAQKKYRLDNISLKDGNQYYCGCCDFTLSSRKLASHHVTQEKHMRNANLPCISIALVNENKYHCGICDVDISCQKSLEDHVNGSQHAASQKKYRPDNISLKAGNQYYCGCCDFTLSSRKLASDHLTQVKHRSNANLPCISITPVDGNKYHCGICDVRIVGEMNIKDHVKGKQHTTAQKKHGCDYISRRNGNLYYCVCCGSTLSSRKLASDHITEEKHLTNANLPCILIARVDKNKYHCGICDVNSFGEIDLCIHVKGRQHAAAQQKHGCDNISLKENNLYYCRCCNRTLTSRQLAFEHIKEKKHMINSDILPCISVVLVDLNKYRCNICDLEVCDKRNLEDHVKSRKHATAKNKYGCDQISLKEGNLYYCRWCNSTFSNRELVSDHIIKTEHTSNVNMPCISVTFVHKNQYRCRICDVNNLDESSLKDHINGMQHSAAKKKYGFDQISHKGNNLYSCKCCDCTLPSRKRAFDHIREKRHMIKNANLPCISITMVDENNYYCGFCDINISGGKDLEDHVTCSLHLGAQEKYGCDNISLNKNDLYYCKCCDCTLPSRELAFEHIKDEKHLINNDILPCISIVSVDKNKYHCKICDIDVYDKKSLDHHVKSNEHTAAKKKYGCDQISLKEGNLYYCRWCDFTFANRQLASNHIMNTGHTRNADMPCISVVFVNKILYRCKICKVNSSGEIDLWNHIKGRRHSDAQRKYGCDNISLKKDNQYYCRCCDSTLANRTLAFDHIKEEKHMDALKVSNKQDQPTTKITNTAESTKQPQCIAKSSQDLLGSNILKLTATDSYCALCDCHIDDIEVNNHVKELQHVQVLKQFSDNGIDVKAYRFYYCAYCMCDISGIGNVRSHIRGTRHANSISMKKLAAGNQEQRTSKEKPQAKQPDVFVSTSQRLLDNFIVKVEKVLNCRICECKIIDETKVNVHITGSQHTKDLQKFYENQICIKNNKFYCRCCNCYIPSCYHVHQHMIGKRHKVFLKVADQGKQLTNQSVAKKPNVAEKTNPKTVVSSLSTHLSKLEKVLGQKLRNKESNGKIPRFNKKIGSETGRMRCSICNAGVVGAINLHIHLARHFNNDFTASNEDTKIEKIVDDMESLEIEQNNVTNNVTKTEAPGRFELIYDVTCEEESCKRVEKPINMNRVVTDLDFNACDIYSMEDKSSDIELGMKLCFVIDEGIVYCLVCQKIIATSIQDYYQHLRSLDHCEYLDRMEKDHELFDVYPDQFSQLELALQYMEEMTNDVVRCLACDQEIDNIDIALQEHIDTRNHNQMCVKLNEKARENFENVKPMYCNWYEVQTYWCVPCITKFKSEVNFALHLKSEIHAGHMKKKQNMKRKLMVDFCSACAVLWYGYRCTWAYHSDNPGHIWLARDGYFTLNEIPMSVKCLLAKPQDYINETIKYFDGVSAKEREKEGILIRDLEKSVKTEFLHAKAYTFGSRVSGLGSPESDIDLFLDCGNMYDGKSSSSNEILNFMTDVHRCLTKEPESWDVEELLTMCRSPIIKAHHRVTGLSCDISFENGLAVENTLLIKSFNEIFPSCRKIILILKQWLKLCKLSGSDGITSYALYWYVIFYLQKESLLPSIANLIAMKNRSRVIAGWEVGVSHEFSYNELEHSFSIKELLIRFFKFYANFDYRQDVACPLLGEIVAKRAFADPQALPKEMERYVAHVENSGKPFRIDSVMCIQDPFDLQHNLSKAVSKVQLNRFRKYCSKSLDVLCA